MKIFSPLEDKIHIFVPPCNFLYIGYITIDRIYYYIDRIYYYIDRVYYYRYRYIYRIYYYRYRYRIYYYRYRIYYCIFAILLSILFNFYLFNVFTTTSAFAVNIPIVIK